MSSAARSASARCMTWDGRLDSRIAAAVVGIQAFKGVEIGLGFEAARRPGSQGA